MKVDYAFILAAGAGTRMGEIGKKLPKVLWPVYERSILELEVLYAKSLGIEKIFINTFYYKDTIKEFYKKSKILQQATLIEEDEVLDIGGAIHNLANELNYEGRLMIFNSDQFIFLSEENWKEAFDLLDKSDHLLFSYNVNSDDLYNSLDLNDTRLVSVTQNADIERGKEIQTYTGMSIINLSLLDKVQGKSNYFKTVGNFEKFNIGVFNIKDSVYWDFGTLSRYEKSMFRILSDFQSNDPFIEFLKSTQSINSEKVNSSRKSYSSNSNDCINLSDNKFDLKNSILLKETSLSEFSQKLKIIYEDIIFEF